MPLFKSLVFLKYLNSFSCLGMFCLSGHFIQDYLFLQGRKFILFIFVFHVEHVCHLCCYYRLCSLSPKSLMIVGISLSVLQRDSGGEVCHTPHLFSLSRGLPFAPQVSGIFSLLFTHTSAQKSSFPPPLS